MPAELVDQLLQDEPGQHGVSSTRRHRLRAQLPASALIFRHLPVETSRAAATSQPKLVPAKGPQAVKTAGRERPGINTLTSRNSRTEN